MQDMCCDWHDVWHIKRHVQTNEASSIRHGNVEGDLCDVNKCSRCKNQKDNASDLIHGSSSPSKRCGETSLPNDWPSPQRKQDHTYRVADVLRHSSNMPTNVSGILAHNNNQMTCSTTVHRSLRLILSSTTDLSDCNLVQAWSKLGLNFPPICQQMLAIF